MSRQCCGGQEGRWGRTGSGSVRQVEQEKDLDRQSSERISYYRLEKHHLVFPLGFLCSDAKVIS